MSAHKELDNEAQLVPAIEIAPISVCVAVSTEFSQYKSGVFTGPCPGEINHAVLLTGYGTEQGTNYWTIKNSWGGSWGDQ